MPVYKLGGSFQDWHDPQGNPIISFNRDGSVNVQSINYSDGTSSTTSFDENQQVVIVTDDEVVPIMSGTVLITKTSQAHLTLPLPVAGAHSIGNDGNSLRFVAVTPFAHQITTSSGGFNGNKTTLTLVPPSSGFLIAYNAIWYVVTNSSGTLS